MKTTLVGYTGFVGGNLARSHTFDAMYNSSNIQQAFGQENGLVIYSGMPAEKFLAAANPAADKAVAENALANIQKMQPERLVLISTVDVYPCPQKVYEDTEPGNEQATAYGANRLYLEQQVRALYPEALIVRLPGLYGKGLKKNFIYDMFTLVPPMLRAEKYAQLVAKQPLVQACYQQDADGFYRLQQGLPAATAQQLKAFFSENDFNSLAFTDSRSVFQFYDLSRLWHDLTVCLKAGLQTINMATAPLRAGDIYYSLFGREFVNHLNKRPLEYDMRTHYGRNLGGSDDYVADANEVLAGIARLATAGL